MLSRGLSVSAFLITSATETTWPAPAEFQSLNIFLVNCAFYEMLSTWNQTTGLSLCICFPFNFLRLGIYWKLKVNNFFFFLLILASYTFLSVLKKSYSCRSVFILSTVTGRKRKGKWFSYQWAHSFVECSRLILSWFSSASLFFLLLPTLFSPCSLVKSEFIHPWVGKTLIQDTASWFIYLVHWSQASY